MNYKGDVFMFLKKIKSMILATLLTLYIIPISVYAYSDYLIPGGENIGIQISSKGIMVVGLYKVGERYPGKDAGIKPGDIILSVNNRNVSTINEMIKEISNSADKEQVIIKYERDRRTYSTTLKLEKGNDDILKTGLYVKDTINGIGTLTFIDPNTRIFGALGHEIMERNTGQKIEVKQGKIFKSLIIGVNKSVKGSPGEKNARFFSDKVYGSIKENTQQGIFGEYTSNIPEKKAYKVARPINVELGNAKIMTVLKDEEVEEFNIEILRLNNTDSKTKNILFNITDEKLLSLTGGIVQGMSGSPIIQNDMIVGAVTHVIVEDTTRGYGIFITNMLEEAEN